MSVVMLQVTLSGKTQVSVARIKARWIEFINNAGGAMKLADINVSSTHGIPLAAGGGSFLTPPYSDPWLCHDLSQWYVTGTDAQVLDVVYDEVK